MNAEDHLKEAKRLYQKTLEEFERAKKGEDSTILRDACGKGWLATQEVTYALLVRKGVNEEELPRSDRGRRFMILKYGERELRRFYFSLRERLHIEGYYDGLLSFEEMKECLEELNLYIQKIEEFRG